MANRGFPTLCCPLCQEDEARISMRLDDAGTSDAFRCGSCEGEFSLDHVRTILEQWAPVIAWIETMPELPAPA